MLRSGGVATRMDNDQSHEGRQASVHYLVGNHLTENTPTMPFGDEVCAFLNDLSRDLLSHKEIRDYPDVASFAYWCRKGNVSALKEKYRAVFALSCGRMGRGLAFHITPSNVPVNFAFSFVFSLVAGNANIVRVPSAQRAQTAIICDAINRVIAKYPDIAKRTAFVQYPINELITASFSLASDVRIIWGGDQTVEAIRAAKCPPHCKDVVFPDRYSIGIINGKDMDRISDEEMQKLAAGLYNDTYLMDQNACSSPQLLFWQYTDESVKQRFWNAVERYAADHYELPPSLVTDKYVQLCSDILKGNVSQPIEFKGFLTVVTLASLPDDSTLLRGKGGYFYQYDIESVKEIVPCVSEKFQTLLYFGYQAKELADALFSARLRGISRIAPFGTAMDIDIIWDGYDLVFELSRTLDVQ